MTLEDASTSNGDPLLGKVIANNFRIQRLIGSGAMGNVYQAEQISLGKHVAVKVLHPHLMGDEKLIKRFQREAKSASRLNHPNSIQIIDSGRDAGGALYIAMELLNGRDLAQVIREDFPLPLPRVVRILSQVLSALDEAHAQGVIHRDLKPSNIMLIERRGEPDFVKVCDYGIAKAQVEDAYGEPQMLTLQGLVCGTPEYMSPEQARGEPLDGRTDLYSAAVILFQMVTGDIPFHGNTPIAIVSRHLSETPVVPSSYRPRLKIPPTLDDLILRGLAKSRDLRPASAVVFRQELEALGSGELALHHRASAATLPASRAAGGGAFTHEIPATTASIVRHSNRRTWILGASGAGLLMLAVVGAIVANRGASLPPSSPPPAALLPKPEAARDPAVHLPHPPAGVDIPGQANPPAPTLVGATPTNEGAPKDDGLAPRITKRLTGKIDARKGAVATGPKVAPPQQTHAAGAATESVGGLGVAGNAGSSVVANAPKLEKAATPAGAKELVTEGDRLLGQGSVSQACQKGEEAKAVAPTFAGLYKFLGKCYMRSGNTTRAKENYRRYLELAPDATDRLFIESIVK